VPEDVKEPFYRDVEVKKIKKKQPKKEKRNRKNRKAYFG
jgi:hypothetical protein